MPPSYVHAVAGDGHGIWALDETQAAAFRIDHRSRKVTLPVARAVGGAFDRSFDVGDPERIVTGFGRLWIGDGVTGALNEVNPSARSVVASVPLPTPVSALALLDPSALAAGDGAVWLTSYARGQLWRVDPNLVSLTKTIQVGRGATGVAVGEGGVWVANSLDGTVSRVDPGTNKVVATIQLGHLPSWVAVGGGRVWVSVQP